MIIEIGPTLAQTILIIFSTFLVLDKVTWYLYHFSPARREDKEVQHIIHEEIVKEGGQEHVS